MFNSAVGTMLKLAAMGVINVPVEPAVRVKIATSAGSTLNGFTINGTSTPDAITGNAAKELPIAMVNTAIPKQFATTSKNRFCSGTMD